MNKATIVCGALLVGSAPAFAGPGSYEPTPEQRAKMSKMMDSIEKKVGGLVARPNSQRGEIVYVNCQTRANRAWIEESANYFARETKFRILVKDGAFDFASPKVDGNATLFVIDDEHMPPILVAPESRWAFVNVAAVAKEKRPAFFEARMKKELTRGFAYLCGAANSQYPRALTRGIVDHKDLDVNHDLRLPVDVISRFKPYMDSLGVAPRVDVTYRKACQEGWAPAPTNDVQKAIWEKVHAIPDKPITIEFGK